MKKRIITTIILIVFLSTNMIMAQKTNFNTDWYSEDDYRFVEKNIYENILWLEGDFMQQNDSVRQNISNIVLKWIMGTPYLIIDIDVEYMMFTPKDYKYIDIINPMYVFGKAKYAIENVNKEQNELEANILGLKSMLKVYNYIRKKDRKSKLEVFEKLKKYHKKHIYKEFINEEVKLSKK